MRFHLMQVGLCVGHVLGHKPTYFTRIFIFVRVN